MRARPFILAAGAAGAVIIAGQLTGASDRTRTLDVSADTTAPTGEAITQGGVPDVIVWSLDGWATYTEAGQFARAYSIGTTSCNIGDAPLNWHANDNQHPVIGQNMFRVEPDDQGRMRIRQLGQSWLKHGFCALDLTFCGPCQGTGCISLGVGCSDPYTAARNGSQSTAGPKFQVNATTGFFPYPPASPSYSGGLARRLQVHLDDVWPEDHPEAHYYVEAQYVHPQDSAEDAGDSSNNVSYRGVSFNFAAYINGFTTDTIRQTPAIMAWQTHDPEVQIEHVQIPNEGNYWVASRAWNNGNGTWLYEYAVQNLDSDRSAASFSVPVADDVLVENMGFSDVAYHSGDGMDGNFEDTDWTPQRSAGAMAWSTASYDSNVNANALRWGTMYTFSFTATTPPVDGEATIGHYKSGATPSFTANVVVPGPFDQCAADFDANNTVNFEDLVLLMADWGACPGCATDLDLDDAVDFHDVLRLLDRWGDC